jgi:hypothetical protein
MVMIVFWAYMKSRAGWSESPWNTATIREETREEGVGRACKQAYNNNTSGLIRHSERVNLEIPQFAPDEKSGNALLRSGIKRGIYERPSYLL